MFELVKRSTRVRRTMKLKISQERDHGTKELKMLCTTGENNIVNPSEISCYTRVTFPV